MPPPIQIPDDTGVSYLIILLFTLMGTAARVFYNWMTGNPHDGDCDNLRLLQQYLDQLRDVDLMAPVWPPEPEFMVN